MIIKASYRVITQITIPVLITIILFIVTIQFIVMPAIEGNIMASKRLMIKELTGITYDFISDYHKRELAGELDREKLQEYAIRKVRNLRYGVDSKNYFWITDLKPSIIMHPYISDLSNQDSLSYIDAEGKNLLKEFATIIKDKGSGYLDYMWQLQTDTTMIIPKLAYVKGFEPWGWIISTNIYLDDVESELSIIKMRLYTAIVGIFILLLIVSAYIIIYGRKVEINKNSVEIALRESEKKYKDIFENSPIGIYRTTSDGKIEAANPALIKMLGYESIDELNKIDLEHDEMYESNYSRKNFKDKIEKEGRIVAMDSIWRRKDRSWLYIRENAQIGFTENKEFSYYDGTVEDITAQKKAEQELLAINEELKATTDALRESNTELNIALKEAKKSKELKIANEKLQRNEKILIQAHNSIKQKNSELEKLNHQIKESHEETQQLNEELESTNEHLFTQKEELESTLEKLKEAQSQLVQSEKMASVGILTSGIAHEINNPLNFIQGGKLGIENYIKNNLKDHVDNLLPLIDIIDTGVQRASEIVKSLNRFNRRSKDNSETCDIHSIIENCLVMIHSNIKNRIELVKDYTNDVFAINGNEGKLHQVFINLLTNAEQAIENEGLIKITTSVEQNDLKIVIQDSGCGISKNNLALIMDPFFTTKDPGKGTGLGLSITYQILQEHNGTIEFKSTEGKGTTVTVKLPINI